jgi:4-hydroxy-tetrahydrodipicolinate synthase
MNSQLEGTGVALITPFRNDGSVDFGSLQKLLDHVIGNGVDYLVVNGTTGESATTTDSEKKEILEFVKKYSGGKLPIVYGLGGNNTRELVAQLKESDLSGVSAILSVSPYYNKPSQEGIFQHYKAIAEASPLPVILYNVPGRTGSNISAKTTVRLSHLPNILGTKEASGDLMQALEIAKSARKGFMLISGDDLLTLPMISFGARGVISVLANAYPGQFCNMVKLALQCRNEEAAEILKIFVQINPCIYEEGNPVGIKTTLDLMGICTDEVRLPLVKGSGQLREKISHCVADMKP